MVVLMNSLVNFQVVLPVAAVAVVVVAAAAAAVVEYHLMMDVVGADVTNCSQLQRDHLRLR